MANIILPENIDLRKTPTRSEYYSGDESQIVLGDLHGNTLKLINLMIKYGFLKLENPERDYQELVKLYTKAGEFKNNSDQKNFQVGINLTKEDITIYRKILDRATIKNDKYLSLIGDELSDRGFNDYFTLLLFEKMAKNDLKFECIASNHGMNFLQWATDFIHSPEATLKKIHNYCYLDNNQGDSLIGLSNVAENILNENEINNLKDIIQNIYFKRLKIISGIIDLENNSIMNLTHAPVDYEVINQLVKKHHIIPSNENIKDKTPMEIMKIYHALNTKLFNSNKAVSDLVTEFHRERDGWDDTKNIPANRALSYCLWNRNINFRKDNLKLNNSGSSFFANGHISASDSDTIRQKYPQILNISDSLGKAWESEKEKNTRERLPQNENQKLRRYYAKYEDTTSTVIASNGLALELFSLFDLKRFKEMLEGCSISHLIKDTSKKYLFDLCSEINSLSKNEFSFYLDNLSLNELKNLSSLSEELINTREFFKNVNKFNKDNRVAEKGFNQIKKDEFVSNLLFISAFSAINNEKFFSDAIEKLTPLLDHSLEKKKKLKF